MRILFFLMAVTLALSATGCDPDPEPVEATRVSRIEVMNLAVAQQVGFPLAGLYPETETSDRNIQDAPFSFTHSDFDDDGRLLRIEVINQQVQDTWHLAADVRWRGDVVVDITITDLQFDDMPLRTITLSGL